MYQIYRFDVILVHIHLYLQRCQKYKWKFLRLMHFQNCNEWINDSANKMKIKPSCFTSACRQTGTFLKWQQHKYKSGSNSVVKASPVTKKTHFCFTAQDRYSRVGGSVNHYKIFLHISEKTKTKVMWNKILHAGPWGHRTEHLLLCQVRVNPVINIRSHYEFWNIGGTHILKHPLWQLSF